MLRSFTVASAALAAVLVAGTSFASPTNTSADVERRAAAILEQLTIEEKIDLAGPGWQPDGVSQALHEEVTFDEGAVTSDNWAAYPILPMAEMPELKVVIAARPEFGVYGQGSESANALAASAITAAFFDATGKPARRIPLKPDYVKAILSS